MMWFDILKESKQTSRQLINLDWDEEIQPEAEEDSCVKRLRQMYEKVTQHKYYFTDFHSWKIENLPESVACKSLEMIADAEFTTDYSSRDERLRIITDSIVTDFEGYTIQMVWNEKSFLFVIFKRGAGHKTIYFGTTAPKYGSQERVGIDPKELDWR
jgi:hypothetical protein